MLPAESIIRTEHERGLLLARPSPASRTPSGSGKRALGLGAPRDGFIYSPPAAPELPLPLLVFLHGAGGDASQADPLLGAAEKHGVLLLSIESRSVTWDMIMGELGPDVAFIDRALRQTFERHAIDARRVALSGFSDGASYALSRLLFNRVLAFSPGFANPPNVSGSPALFVSHGTSDKVLPIDACSRKLVPRLRRSGYRIEYREFDGGHSMPAPFLDSVLSWLIGASAG
jgi:phospholipase/carboxylesterase